MQRIKYTLLILLLTLTIAASAQQLHGNIVASAERVVASNEQATLTIKCVNAGGIKLVITANGLHLDDWCNDGHKLSILINHADAVISTFVEMSFGCKSIIELTPELVEKFANQDIFLMFFEKRCAAESFEVDPKTWQLMFNQCYTEICTPHNPN